LIYLDCDVVVKQSLAELFNTDLDNCYLAAVEDVCGQSKAQRLGLKQYFNSGVLAVNLQAWRKDDIPSRLLEWIENNREKMRGHDQEALNAVLGERVTLVSRRWNAQVSNNEDMCVISGMHEIAKDAAIVHFICKKPWNHANSNPFEDLYFEYIKLTPWRNFLLYKRVTRFIRRILQRIF
jgi:lipopolysaccharide biosynthesis glycosyltransferase